MGGRLLVLSPTILVGLLAALTALAGPRDGAKPVARPPEAVVREFRLAPFYAKYLSVEGLPVVGSARVSDAGLREAAYLIERMLAGREDIARALVRSRVRFAVMAPDEMTTAVPEHSDLTPSKFWDRRARGLGATRERPAVSCGEENLLGYTGDPYRGESILIHEFSHAIHIMGLRNVDPGFEGRLRRIYDAAMAKGLWKGTYAATNSVEYWAEGVQSWFDCNQKPNHSHGEVDTRGELEAYDPELAALIASVFRTGTWRYTPVSARFGRDHLAGYDPSRAPTFRWDPALTAWYEQYQAEEARKGKRPW